MLFEMTLNKETGNYEGICPYCGRRITYEDEICDGIFICPDCDVILEEDVDDYRRQ